MRKIAINVVNNNYINHSCVSIFKPVAIILSNGKLLISENVDKVANER